MTRLERFGRINRNDNAEFEPLTQTSEAFFFLMLDLMP